MQRAAECDPRKDGQRPYDQNKFFGLGSAEHEDKSDGVGRKFLQFDRVELEQVSYVGDNGGRRSRWQW